MPKTIVKCSMPGCREDAESKLAAPWKDGRHAELKTYGFACSAHAEPILAYARQRPKPRHLAASETVGVITTYSLGRVRD
jgi:hypothetical protein